MENVRAASGQPTQLVMRARNAGVTPLSMVFALGCAFDVTVYDARDQVANAEGDQHALRGRWENLWAAEPGCNVELLDTSDLLDKLVYVATNPVKDFPVDTVAHWPGVNTLADLLAGRELEATRPRRCRNRSGGRRVLGRRAILAQDWRAQPPRSSRAATSALASRPRITKRASAAVPIAAA